MLGVLSGIGLIILLMMYLTCTEVLDEKKN